MNKHILICDDDKDILEVCTTILNISGYKISTSINCNNIIQLVQETKPDLILMDLWVPDLGGEIALQTLRDNPSTKHIPVLFFSANNHIEKITARSSADGFLKKPFDINTMEDTINAFLKNPVLTK